MITRTAARPGNTPVWGAIGAALAAVLLVTVAVFAYQTLTAAGGRSPLVTVATGAGPADLHTVPVTKDLMTSGETAAVTVRLHNASTDPVVVSVTVTGTRASHPASLTAALTSAGAVTRSGALSSLTLPEVVVAGGATVPVTLDLNAPVADIAAGWDEHGDFGVAVGVVGAGRP